MKVHVHGIVDHGIWPLPLHSRTVCAKRPLGAGRLCRLDLNIGILRQSGARSRAHIVDVGRGPVEVEIVEGHDFNRYFTSTSSDGVRAVEMSQKQEY
jgi:hypothetical protein